jgi:hypothetical protein
MDCTRRNTQVFLRTRGRRRASCRITLDDALLERRESDRARRQNMSCEEVTTYLSEVRVHEYSVLNIVKVNTDDLGVEF